MFLNLLKITKDFQLKNQSEMNQFFSVIVMIHDYYNELFEGLMSNNAHRDSIKKKVL